MVAGRREVKVMMMVTVWREETQSSGEMKKIHARREERNVNVDTDNIYGPSFITQKVTIIIIIIN